MITTYGILIRIQLEFKMMEDINTTTLLCRICLKDGASLPIFENLETKNNVFEKLSYCLQCYKIEDIDGFPRHICTACNTTLETLFNFINKYKESSKILEDGLEIVNKENDFNNESDAHFEVEINIDGIKVESDSHYDDDDLDDEKPFTLSQEKRPEPIKKETRPRKRKTCIGAKTNKIASSILEGNFLWNGDKWCVNIGQTTVKKLRSKEEKKLKPRPQTKITMPHLCKKPEKKLCECCGDVFQNQDKLNNHKKNVHYKKPVQCPKCPRICVSDYRLKRHMKRKHDNTRDFICSACGRGFVYKGELTSHFKNVHNKHLKPKKIYTCKFCDKTYKCQKSTLIHERSVHTGQRPAQCNVCGNSFYHEDYLKEHMRLHTGETPFKCPICGRGYAQRGNMKSHLRIHRKSELDAATLSKMKPNYLKLLKV